MSGKIADAVTAVCVPKEEFDADQIGRVILECVRATGSRFGGQYIADIVRGSRNERILKFGHDRLSCHGQGKVFADGQIREIINLMIEKGLLAKTTGEYPVIELTSVGWQFLQGQERLLLPQLRVVTKEKELQRVKKSFAQKDVNAAYDERLFEELRKLRKQLANERNVPPFVIFADTALRQMARDFPTNSESFLAITGVGEQKLKQFGPLFIPKIADYWRENVKK